jgi:beta,beta-carotene 9',10'-dioxygenase
LAREFAIGFKTLKDEIIVDKLPIEGNIPSWLEGTLVRNGPAKFEFGKRRYNTWLDGMAMLNKFSFKEGTISYANKYIQSNTLKENSKANTIKVAEFATDPCRTIFQRFHSMFFPKFTDNTSVNIAHIADKYVAMTETSIPIEFDTETMATLAHLDYTGKVKGQLTTAHPHYDFERNEIYNYTTQMFIVSHYNIYRLPYGANERILVSSIPVLEPSYMHSFGMTENYIILAEFPLEVYPGILLIGFSLLDRPFIENFNWRPRQGTNFLVVRKSGGELVGKYNTDPFFAFHHINAFEEGDNIVLDIAAFEDASIIRELFLDRLCGEEPDDLSFAEFRRYHIPLHGGKVCYESISDQTIELPRINYRHYNAKSYNHAYGISFIKDRPGDWYNQLVKINIEQKDALVWHEEHCYPGEPVFVPSSDATREDDGVILSVVLNAQESLSFLLVLNAQTFTELGRATVPLSLPFGFHGQYLPLISPEQL